MVSRACQHDKTQARNASNSTDTLHARLASFSFPPSLPHLAARRRLLFAAASYFLANKSLKNEPAPSSERERGAPIASPVWRKKERKKHLHLHIVRRAHCEVQSRRRQANVLRTKYIHRPPPPPRRIQYNKAVRPTVEQNRCALRAS